MSWSLPLLEGVVTTGPGVVSLGGRSFHYFQLCDFESVVDLLRDLVSPSAEWEGRGSHGANAAGLATESLSQPSCRFHLSHGSWEAHTRVPGLLRSRGAGEGEGL